MSPAIGGLLLEAAVIRQAFPVKRKNTMNTILRGPKFWAGVGYSVMLYGNTLIINGQYSDTSTMTEAEIIAAISAVVPNGI